VASTLLLPALQIVRAAGIVRMGEPLSPATVEEVGGAGILLTAVLKVLSIFSPVTATGFLDHVLCRSCVDVALQLELAEFVSQVRLARPGVWPAGFTHVILVITVVRERFAVGPLAIHVHTHVTLTDSTVC